MPHTTRLTPVLQFSAAVCVIAALLVFVLPGSSPVIASLQNSGHALAFALIALLITPLFQRQSLSLKLLLAFVVCIVIGAAVEVLQSYLGRQSSIYDLLLDASGATAGLLIYLARETTDGPRRLLGLGFAAVIMIFSFSPPMVWYFALSKRDQSLPTLVLLEDHFQHRLIDSFYGGQTTIVDTPKEFLNATGKAVKLSIPKGALWPGFKLVSPPPSWNNWEIFAFDVYSISAEPIRLTVRINDNRHNNSGNDRFNTALMIQPGVNSFEIAIEDIRNGPAHRPMDMFDISKVAFYVDEPENNHILYFDNLRVN
jgi:VanZ family protein